MKTVKLFLVLFALVLWVSAAAAGDFEYSPRFTGMADTGNAIFNPPNHPPVYENIACAVDSNKFYIGGESRALTLYGFGTENDVDYNALEVKSGGYIKSAFPLGEDDEDDWTGRVGLIFVPGVQTELLRVRINDSDTDLDLTDLRVVSSPTIRLGASYGFHEVFAAGLGFTITPTTIFTNDFQGTQDTPDGRDNTEFQDSWTIMGPFAITPEVGFLWRTNDGMQFGLTYEMGYFDKAKREVQHTTSEGDIDYDTRTAVIKPHNIGLGWAYRIPNIDDFFVAMDFDAYFSQSYKGDTYDVRSGQDYYTRPSVPSKYDPDPDKALDPNREKIGRKYYASTNARYIFSTSIEKAWETVGLRGGLGYSAETGLTRDRPTSTFFTTVGPTLFFDEAVFMSFAGRFDIGFSRAETTYLMVGSGVSASLGGTF